MVNKKAETIEKIKSMGYEITSSNHVRSLNDKYWIGRVLGDGRLKIDYYNALNRMEDQIKIRDDSKGVGIDIVAFDREEAIRYAERRISRWKGLLEKI